MDDFDKEYGELLKGKSPEVIEQCRQRYEYYKNQRETDQETSRLAILMRQKTDLSILECRRLLQENQNDFDKAVEAARKNVLKRMRPW